MRHRPAEAIADERRRFAERVEQRQQQLFDMAGDVSSARSDAAPQSSSSTWRPLAAKRAGKRRVVIEIEDVGRVDQRRDEHDRRAVAAMIAQRRAADRARSPAARRRAGGLAAPLHRPRARRARVGPAPGRAATPAVPARETAAMAVALGLCCGALSGGVRASSTCGSVVMAKSRRQGDDQEICEPATLRHRKLGLHHARPLGGDDPRGPRFRSRRRQDRRRHHPPGADPDHRR